MSTRVTASGLDLKRWTEGHALAIVSMLLGVVSGIPAVWFAMVAALSFSALIWKFRMKWTPFGRFGPANAITLFRLLGILLLWLHGISGFAAVAAAALFLFALDAVDGWVARRRGLSSDFGEFFDKEVDAFFLLVLCAMLYLDRHIGMWILIPGLLRYLFVGYLSVVGPREIKEQRSRLGCWSYFLMILAAISAFVVGDPISVPLLIGMSCVLVFSFGDSVRRLHWPKALHEES
ncbi:MAG: CDP-alcohol phosphatidyltransferase family protein [Gammaproteobacteria bacterium]